jgi:gamma-glutamyltranspeptidase/glutathione hydrolase
LIVVGLFLIGATAAAVVTAAQPEARRDSSSAEPVYQHSFVAADHPLASEAGVEILKQGGNVVDAAVATGFALSVVRPASSGIGGGGFMVIWDAAKKQATAIDYRERAPARATRDMYVDPADRTKVREDASRYGPLAIAVPAHVAGLCFALKEHGSLDLKAVLAPALRLCREGVPVDPHHSNVQREVLNLFQKRPGFSERFATLNRLYLNGGKAWRSDERFFSPLGPVLERISAGGADGFHQGPVAEAIVGEVRRGGGLISLDDLAAIKPTVREPLTGRFGDLQLFTMPPPSSGGVALLETLQILESSERRWPERNLSKLPFVAPERLHLLTEAFKHAFADRATYLGDPDFADIPFRRLISPEHAAQLAARIDLAHTQVPERYGRFTLPNDGGTSHFSIIDAAGNAVACTETINNSFGSLIVEPTFGIILNNEMDDFTAHPDIPNGSGLRQSAANAIAPGKRPLSSMTPTIAVRDGRAVFAVGASGGPRIITATTQVLLNLIRYEMSPEQAVSAPRLHHQWFPDRLELEPGFDRDVARGLYGLDHVVGQTNEGAAVQAVSRRPDGLRGGSDPRKHGRPAGH